jgi:hypothetical protein
VVGYPESVICGLEAVLFAGLFVGERAGKATPRLGVRGRGAQHDERAGDPHAHDDFLEGFKNGLSFESERFPEPLIKYTGEATTRILKIRHISLKFE